MSLESQAFSEFSDNSLKPTQLDLDKINSLNIGESMISENRNFKIMRYKDEYVLLLFNSYNYKDFSEWGGADGLNRLIKFLNEN